MGTVTISFDPDDLKDCERAVGEMGDILWEHLRPAMARQLLSKATPSRRQIGADSNLQLMAMYVAARKEHGIGVRRFAAVIAKCNEGVPPDELVGPRGSTDSETIAKQIYREKDRAAKDPAYMKLIEEYADIYRKDIPE